jgi:Protein of unknown function DUF262
MRTARQTRLKHVVMTALVKDGVTIQDVDMIEDEGDCVDRQQPVAPASLFSSLSGATRPTRLKPTLAPGRTMAKIENHKYTIEEAFRECFYIVPDYQREYVWTDKEVQQLLDDIDEQIDGGRRREYFIGTILVAPTDERNHYEVIDGQQRLTTFFLLLCALKQRFAGEPQAQTLSSLISTSFTDSSGNVVTTLKLDPRYESAGEVMQKLLAANAAPQTVRAAVQAAGIPSFGSLENLLAAYATIHRYLDDNYDDTAQLKKHWGYLANNVIFIQISADVSSALKIFETINERGVGLNPMDLLKNLLFTNVRQAEAALRSGQRDIALSLAQERLSSRPESVPNRRFLQQAVEIAA